MSEIGLRMMGKDPSGKAKAIKTDYKGVLEASLGVTTGKNLFNLATVIMDRTIISDGTSQSGNVGWYHSDHIRVLPGNKVVFNNLILSTSGGTAFYKDGVFVSWLSNTSIVNNNFKLTVPNGVNSMRCTNNQPYGVAPSLWQIEYGEVPTSYESYREYDVHTKIAKEIANSLNVDVQFDVMQAKDASGQNKPLTVEIDNNGEAILRVVDAAPVISEISSFENSTQISANVTSTSTLVLPQNTLRKYAVITNNSEGPVFISFGINAEINKGICLPTKYTTYEMTGMKGNLFKGGIHAIHDGSEDRKIMITEGF